MSKTAICNRALQKVGAEARLTDADLDGATNKEARECDRAYDPVRKAALRLHPWNFALGRAAMGALSEAPAWGYGNQYQWPDGALRIVAVEDDEIGITWRVEGRKILTDDAAPLNILYIDDVEDTAQFDAQFAEIFAHLLAIEVVETLTQSNTKKQLLREELRDLLATATRTDAQEGTPEELAEDTWIQARA